MRQSAPAKPQNHTLAQALPVVRDVARKPEATPAAPDTTNTLFGGPGHNFGSINVHPRGGNGSARPVWIQPKLSINQPGDMYEREADAVADKIMRMGEPDGSVSINSASTIQRKCAACEEEEKIQRKETNASDISATAQTENYISSLPGKGRLMTDNERSFFEPKLQYDFSNVRVHTDREAHQSALDINARAYTYGHNIVFGAGQYQPKTTNGKQLLAHVMQQNGPIGKKSIQRVPQTAETTSAPPQPATDGQIRELVMDATYFLESAAQFYTIAEVNDALLERVLTRWIVMSTIYPGYIETRLGDDTALMQGFKDAFNHAVRALFMRRAAQTTSPVSVISLYLQNIYRLPQWSWPDVASFNLQDEPKRRSFVRSYITALNEASLFQGFTPLTTASLESVLSYLFTLTTDTQHMLADNLANDRTLVSGLQAAYSAAINNLLSRAVLSLTTETVFGLFIRYRYQRTGMIHEWADQKLAGMTPAVPLGQSADPLTGEVNFDLNGWRVTIKPDGRQTATGAVTHTDVSDFHIPYIHSRNRIISFTAPAVPSVEIWTDYGPGLNENATSGYGRGTTTEDNHLGNTSLGYHERSHSRDYLNFMATNPPPTFGGTVGMTVAQFRRQIRAYNTAFLRMARVSELATDCVGSPDIEQFHIRQETHSTVTCH